MNLKVEDLEREINARGFNPAGKKDPQEDIGEGGI